MATPIRHIHSGEYYHVYNRGNNKQHIFLDETDYQRFLQSIRKYKQKTGIILYSYCLMPNHFHFLLQEPMHSTPGVEEPKPLGSSVAITQFAHLLQTAYAKYISLKYKKDGHVFQGRFQSKHVATDPYLQFLSCYIHFNPQEAMLVDDAVKWPYSSLKSYLSSEHDPFIDTKIFPYEGAYEQLYQSYLLYKKEKDQLIQDLSFDLLI